MAKVKQELSNWLHLSWFTRRWWKWLLADCKGWRHLVCRVRGHPYPVRWFTPHRDEPDMRCHNCDEDLG